MERMKNLMRREAEAAMRQLAMPRIGIVTSYDPATYAAKVLVQPEGHETGFLPVATTWSGNGWGLFCPPTPGDVVDVHYVEGSKQAAYIALRHYGDRFRPLGVPSGEFWLVDKLGNSFKFSDSKVLLNGHTEIDMTTPTLNITASTAVNVTAPNFNLTGNLNVTGNIAASGDITDLNDASGTLNSLRIDYNAHRHPGVQTGGASTGTTDHPV